MRFLKDKEYSRSWCFFVVTLSSVIITAYFIYSDILTAPFFFDDLFNIVSNEKLHDLGNFWPPLGNRYFVYLSFGINYYFGGLDVFGYHIVNVVIHVINSVLVFWLTTLVFRTPLVKEGLKDDNRVSGLCVALLSGLIFLAHPLQTSAVTYITQRFASLATLFYLLSLSLFVAWRLRYAYRGRRTAQGVALYLAALVFAVVAQRTKEISFTLPFMVVLVEFAFFSGRNLSSGKRVLSLAPFLSTAIIIPASLLLQSRGIGLGSIVDDGMSVQQLEDIAVLSSYEYLVTQFRVVVTYLRLLFLPINQNVDYDYPVFHSILNLQVLSSLLLLLSMLAVAVYLFGLSRKKKNPLLMVSSFGIFWFFLTLSVESSVIPIKDVIFEHRVYLPGYGIILMFSSLAFHALNGRHGRTRSEGYYIKATAALVLIVVVPLSITAHNRNRVWGELVTLYEDIVAKSPKKARAHNNLGKAYAEKGMMKKAVEEFETTLKLDDTLVDTHRNLAKSYEAVGRAADAVREYRRYLGFKPYDAAARTALAAIYVDNSMFDPAAEEYMKILAMTPDNADARNNLANLYFLKRDYDDAIKHYKKVLSLRPYHLEARYNIAIASEFSGNVEEALFHYRLFVESAPSQYRSLVVEVYGRMERLAGPSGK